MVSKKNNYEMGRFGAAALTIGNMLDRVVLIVAAILLSIMSITLLVGIFMRYVFYSPPIWIEEVVRYFMIWAVCLSMSSGLKRCEHISIHFALDAMPASIQRIIGYFLNLVLVGLLLVLFIYGIQLAQLNLDYTSPALEVNMGFVLSIVPLSAALMLIQLVINFIVTKSNHTYTGKI